VAVLTLALGIGVSTALFSVIDAAMLHPLPYRQPEQLVTINVEIPQPDGRISQPTVSMEDVRTWQQSTDLFTVVAGAGSAFRGRIADGPEPERLQVAHYTEDYLSMHGVAPILGRDFVRADTEPDAPLVALLGYGYWQRRFGGRDDVVGETLRLDDDLATIVGVLPASFDATTPVATPLQVPLADYPRRGTGRVSAYARLRPGVTVEQASALLSTRMPQDAGNDGAGAVGVRVESRLERLVSRYRSTVNVLAGAVALILGIAVVNVAGLLLARGAARQAELGVRASLGATRGRLVRQLLTESASLALPAAVIGVLLAWLTLNVIVASLPLRMPADAAVGLNLTVLGLTTALLVPTTLLFGLVPALHLSRVQIGATMARGSRQVGASLSRRGSQVLIAAEVALAVVLTAGAGLMIRSFVRMSAVPLGFNADGLVTMHVLPLARDPLAHKNYYWALQQQLQATPGVVSVGIVDNFPLAGGGSYTSVRGTGDMTGATVFGMTPGYLETIGATLRVGRFPTDAEYASGFRGVVVNESAAGALFPDRPAVGGQITPAGDDTEPWTVMGVIADLRHGGPLADVSGMRGLQVFFPLTPTEFDLNAAMTVVVRPSSRAPGLAQRLRQTAQDVDPRVLVERIRTADERFGMAVITPQRRLVLLTLLGGLGLTLALVGVFGMTAYAVARRTSEVGVRMAFGARPRQIVASVLRDAAVPIGVGALAGVGGALMATRAIESFLFQTAPTDPVTLAAVAGTLAVTGGLAALVPSLRAARIDPALTLKAE